MLWPKVSPLDLDFGLCAWAKLFNNESIPFLSENGQRPGGVSGDLATFPNLTSLLIWKLPSDAYLKLLYLQLQIDAYLMIAVLSWVRI